MVCVLRSRDIEEGRKVLLIYEGTLEGVGFCGYMLKNPAITLALAQEARPRQRVNIRDFGQNERYRIEDYVTIPGMTPEIRQLNGRHNGVRVAFDPISYGEIIPSNSRHIGAAELDSAYSRVQTVEEFKRLKENIETKIELSLQHKKFII
jgi:hypothetical protein